MTHPLLENYRYYLNDNVHFFLVQRDDQREKRVLFFRGNIHLANEKLMDRDLDVLKADLESRR